MSPPPDRALLYGWHVSGRVLDYWRKCRTHGSVRMSSHRGRPMRSARLAQLAGACAAIGGSAWVAAIVLHAMQPRGCIGDECFVRPMREATTATSLLVMVTAAALLAFLLALVALLARTGSLGWTGITGVVACVLGLGLLALVSVSPLRDQLRPAPFLATIAVGLALLGWTVLRSGVVPIWAGLGLLVGVLLLAGVSEQTSRVLLALPFGMAWLATGLVLVQRSQTMPGV